jgi:uncharacterized membrane protein
MRPLWQFIKTTIIGGIVFLVPLIVLVMLLAKAHELLSKAVHPLAQMVTNQTSLGVIVADVIAALLLVFIGFAAGLVASTRAGREVQTTAENLILRKLPGYTLMKSVAHGTLGVGDGSGVSVVLATIDDAWLLAFLIEELPDGMRTVFVPSAPTPAAGNIYFMREDQIRRLDVSVAAAIKCIMELGVGSGELLAKSRSTPPITAVIARPAA